MGAAALTVAGTIGPLPFEATTADVDMFGTVRPWWVPMGIIVLIATAFAYATGIAAAVDVVRDRNPLARRRRRRADSDAMSVMLMTVRLRGRAIRPVDPMGMAPARPVLG